MAMPAICSAVSANGPSVTRAIAALHAGAAAADDTDWPQIASLYAELWQRPPSPSVGIGLAVAEGMALGPERGLERLAALEAADLLAGSSQIAAARADLLRRAGQLEAAAAAHELAAGAAPGDRERRITSAAQKNAAAERHLAPPGHDGGGHPIVLTCPWTRPLHCGRRSPAASWSWMEPWAP